MDWYQVKLGISQWSGLSMDALHVHAGLLLMMLTAAVTRRPIASPIPWLVVLLFSLANEWWDLAYETWPEGSGQMEESVRDVLNTVAAPFVLMLLARAAPTLFVDRAREEQAAPPDVR